MSVNQVSTDNFTTAQESNHSSGVAGIIFGDLRDGQDSGVTALTDRIARSGYAGESRGWLYNTGFSSIAFDHLKDLSGGTKPVVTNMSAGSSAGDPACEGRKISSLNANALYESGTLVIKSAGNEGHVSTTDCTVTAPGSAISVFTVASLGAETRTDGMTSDVRQATVLPDSSRGGTSTEGGRRTIVDMAAYGCRQLMLDSSGGYTYQACGTGFAASTVTGAAINFIDYYKHDLGDLIDDPGVLFAQLLLMGNRQQDGTTKLTSGYDNLYGSGALRARQFDEAGMDAPWSWTTGIACIEQGEQLTLPINDGNVISTEVDAFKAVLWWYDARHATDGTVDDIDLRLKTTTGTTLAESVTFDNKERIFSSGVGGQSVQLEIMGFSATADNTGCGTDSMRVYYSSLQMH